jgi:uncharacterized protein (TIGR00251 family)
MKHPPYFRIRGKKIYLDVIVSPGAKQDKIVGIYGDRLKISISAPPVDGKANKHLLNYLAKVFSCPKTNISLESGETSKRKTISLEGIDWKIVNCLP